MLTDTAVNKPKTIRPDHKLIGRLNGTGAHWYPEPRRFVGLASGDIFLKNDRATLATMDAGRWYFRDVTPEYLASKEATK
jgi:hypothetical protein